MKKQIRINGINRLNESRMNPTTIEPNTSFTVSIDKLKAFSKLNDNIVKKIADITSQTYLIESKLKNQEYRNLIKIRLFAEQSQEVAIKIDSLIYKVLFKFSKPIINNQIEEFGETVNYMEEIAQYCQMLIIMVEKLRVRINKFLPESKI
ncbi:hypothetical protein [Sporomusa acidovorans]|uniref:Uncharacterized protein n=1 Tax=Sporomusa acidovorans (strain ATCC 49682 / DSM 3132 / Mol) TaxID=1123286 RepID=A0ABZ3JC01_SPOA4|nr:hypothetical protein [Sporomusa acidovorans]OZC16977.1 hypothetical protein SPACI_39470 [Sporomusa acidovorans DSM 3132]SDF33068.1 hypothetical protein SAMN04488499_10444 [Sporomusa acidovorans]